MFLSIYSVHLIAQTGRQEGGGEVESSNSSLCGPAACGPRLLYQHRREGSEKQPNDRNVSHSAF